MTTTTDSPRIYVASLSDYNAGRLHGRWIDADQDADEIMEEVSAMLAESPEPGAEEWAIHDYEGFHGIRIDESDSFEHVATLAQAIAEHGGAFAAWAGNDPNYNTDPDDFAEQYLGEWDSLTAYAEEWIDSTGTLDSMPENLRGYFDYEAFGRDLRLGGDVWTADSGNGTVYVFQSV